MGIKITWGYRVITGTLDMSGFIWFYGFISHLYLPTRRLADSSTIVQERLAAMDRVFEVFDTEPDIHDTLGARHLSKVVGTIAVQDVCFS